jgi:hypothetical protein
VAANPLIADPGPEFDPEEAADAPPPPPATPLQAVDVHWQPDRVAQILRGQGVVTHEVIGVGEEDWLWRDGELTAIAEPAANVLNKFPVTHAAAAVSDELTVGAVFLNYSLRSIRERTRVLRARKEAAENQPQPITGYDAAGERMQWKIPGEEEMPT